MMLPVLIIVTVLSMLACYQIARSRDARVLYWVIAGLLFGPLAIPFACFAKPAAKS